jgi:hypothetical protein
MLRLLGLGLRVAGVQRALPCRATIPMFLSWSGAVPQKLALAQLHHQTTTLPQQVVEAVAVQILVRWLSVAPVGAVVAFPRDCHLARVDSLLAPEL